MKKIYSFFAASLLALTASAMPVQPGTFTVRQSDGTELTLRKVGDEHFHYYINVATGQEMLLNANGDYYAVSPAQMGQLKADARVRQENANTHRLERLERYRTAPANVEVTGQKKVTGTFTHLTGKKKGLVILVNFAGSDIGLPYEMTTTRQDWDDAFNKRGYDKNGAVGSVCDYFIDQSYGEFELDFDVVGPVTVSNKVEYYGQNNSYGSDKYAYMMVIEACKLVDDQVNFKDYDWDNDGEVDQVFVVYAGQGESISGVNENTIWPHEYTLEYSSYRRRLPIDGIYVNTYACSYERGEKTQCGIGTACHEFSHCLGYPDFYDVDYKGGVGTAEFDIMCAGGHNGPDYNCEVPAGYTAYERWMAGWLEPKVLTDPCEIKGMKNIGDVPEAYIIYNDADKNEYFLLENRDNNKWFSYVARYEAPHGLLMTHVDYLASVWRGNRVNVEPDHQRMYYVAAGKTYGKLTGSGLYMPTAADFQSMLFPGSKNVREINDNDYADWGIRLFNANNGSTKLGKLISEIEENPTDGTLSFLFMGNVDKGQRYTITLNAGDGTVAQSALKQESNCQRLVLPAATPAKGNARFIGWTTANVQPTTQRPAVLYTAGTAYRPSANEILYAVYATSQDGVLEDTYHYVESLTYGKNYVFANKKTSAAGAYCISSEGLTVGSSDMTQGIKEVEILSLDGEAVILNPAPDCVWNAHICDESLLLLNGAQYFTLDKSKGAGLSDNMFNLGWTDKNGIYVTTGNSTAKSFVNIVSGSYNFPRSASTTSRIFAFEQDEFAGKNVSYFTSAPEGIVTLEAAPAANSVTYDLSGRRISDGALQHGVIIKNGKKIVR